MSLEDFGWTPFFAASFEQWDGPGSTPGRVSLASRGFYQVQVAQGEWLCRLSGRQQHDAAFESGRLPVVGDWVVCRDEEGGTGLITEILPRRSKLSRHVPGGRTAEQIVAANVDTVLVVMGLDRDFSLRRLERLLTLAYEGGIEPVAVLNKADRVGDADERRLEVESLAPGVPVLAISALQDQGLDRVRQLLRPARTFALIGSSGAGKSTLINRLFGVDLTRTGEVRVHDGRGRHTTTERQLFRHPAGALLIDTPGIREVGLWGSEEGLEEAFDDVLALADGCRFQDCRHESEPGCAVREAIEDGLISSERLESYLKLQKELHYLKIRVDEGAQRAQKQKWRAIHKSMRREAKLLRPRRNKTDLL
ncbi:MAG: ribosome small subunit-dependent GTPase A [Acidobacteriota bacterium]